MLGKACLAAKAGGSGGKAPTPRRHRITNGTNEATKESANQTLTLPDLPAPTKPYQALGDTLGTPRGSLDTLGATPG